MSLNKDSLEKKPGPLFFRSDTSTLPTEEMLAAMSRAKLGDDGYKDDPTVNALEELGASIAGKEASLFVPSGTMGNLIALMVHGSRGKEIIVGNDSHVLLSEQGGYTAIAGLIPKVIPLDLGVADPVEVEKNVRKNDPKNPDTGLIWLENTHNLSGGTITPVEVIDQVGQVSQSYGVPLHMDGARIFNASVELGIPASRLLRAVDSVMFCLSKGLSAPVGSILAGSKQFIQEARKVRKLLGGGMRQAGVLAAAGIVALEKMIGRLKEDNENARLLANSICDLPGLRMDLDTVQTNMVYFDLSGIGVSSQQFAEGFKEYGVVVSTRPPSKIRMVTHRQISQTDVLETAEKIRIYWNELVKKK